MEKFMHLQVKYIKCPRCGNDYLTIGGYGKCPCRFNLITDQDRHQILALPFSVLYESIVDDNHEQLKKLYRGCQQMLRLIEESLNEGDNNGCTIDETKD